MHRVVVYHAEGCHLCERAVEVIEAVRLEHPFELELVDIGADTELEARYRERIPIVEIDGEPAFTFFVAPDALAARVR